MRIGRLAAVLGLGIAGTLAGGPVVRLKATDRFPWSLVSAPLLELADFPMMRKQLLGIKARAEASGGVSLTGGR